MGLFSSKKTYVSSSVYNMAGDINDRSNYLKTLITSHILTNNGSKTISSSIQEGYGKGPGIKLRNFALWSRDNFPAVGTATANLYSKTEIDPDLILPLVPHDINQTVNIQRTDLKMADYSYWAEQWMLENEPALISSKWTTNFDETTMEITIVLEDGTSVAFTPDGFDKSKLYLFALYNLIRGVETGPTENGAELTGAYPSTSGWTVTSNVSSTDNRVLSRVVKTTVTYSDGRAPEITTVNTTSNGSYTYYRGTLEKTEYQGSTGDTGGTDQLYSIKKTMYLKRDGVVSETNNTTETRENLNDGTLVRVTKVETMQEVLVVTQRHQINTQEVTRQTFSPAQLLIYEIGSGGSPALDVKVTERDQDSFYFPFIPVRLDNKMVDGNNSPTVRPQLDAAYRKLTGSKQFEEDIVQPVGNHQSIKDMDYVYIMLGVSLNTKENSAKKYLYRFFERLRLTQEVGLSDYEAWRSKQQTFETESNEWLLWRLGQDGEDLAYFGQEMPNYGTSYTMPTNEVRIRGNGTLPTNLDTTISWSSINVTNGVGQRKPDMKVGDYVIEYVSRDIYSSSTYSGGEDLDAVSNSVDHIAIHWQMTANSWKTLNIIGLVHRNFIYQGKYVETTARTALADPEESGFLIPLHYETYKELSLVDSTQLSTACVYLVINSYQVVKKNFFQSTFFKILLIVAVIAITVATGGIGAGGVGLLGTNAAVGTAIGLTGTAAIIAGAVANAIVAMILMRVITAGATLVFGDKLGAIIGAIASIVALQVGTAFANSQSLASSFGSLMKADNIIQMTSSVGQGVAGYMQAGAIQMGNQIEQLNKDFAERSREISKLMGENLGSDKAKLDPFALMSDGEFVSAEDANSFLQRTLMTGSDVADLSLSMLSNFANITLSTELKL